METRLQSIEILKDFHKITGARISLHDLDFNEISAYPETKAPFCRKIQETEKGRAECYTADREAFFTVKKTGQPFTYKCHCGLIETVAPIYNYGTLTGYVMMGQISDDQTDSFSKIKSSYFYYLNEQNDCLISEIPIIKNEMLKSFVNILDIIAQYLTDAHRMTAKDRDLPHAVKTHIHKFYSKPLSVRALCETFGCSRTTLMNTFKSRYGITIGDYITEYRLNMAKTMLNSSNESIKAIATDCGFRDQNYFTKVFRNAFNVTPTEYRNSIK